MQAGEEPDLRQEGKGATESKTPTKAFAELETVRNGC